MKTLEALALAAKGIKVRKVTSSTFDADPAYFYAKSNGHFIDDEGDRIWVKLESLDDEYKLYEEKSTPSETSLSNDEKKQLAREGLSDGLQGLAVCAEIDRLQNMYLEEKDADEVRKIAKNLEKARARRTEILKKCEEVRSKLFN